jgi:hypothetical protein
MWIQNTPKNDPNAKRIQITVEATVIFILNLQ